MQLSCFNNVVAYKEAHKLRREVCHVAGCAVDNAISEALAWIASDPCELFLYKYPRECEDDYHQRMQSTANTTMLAASTPTMCNNSVNSVDDVAGISGTGVVALNRKEPQINWLCIRDFSIEQIVRQVRDYLSMWHLTSSIKYVVQLERDMPRVRPQGRTYHLTAYFTQHPKPNNKPIKAPVMAKVHFMVHVSRLLPIYYPVMVTYCFENCNCIYYALGRRRVRSLDFQRFYIDMTLEAKSGFYAQLLDRFAWPKHEQCTRQLQPDNCASAPGGGGGGGGSDKNIVTKDQHERECSEKNHSSAANGNDNGNNDQSCCNYVGNNANNDTNDCNSSNSNNEKNNN